jgi:glycosyltransferase involved in cell wall biosynthesis
MQSWEPSFAVVITAYNRERWIQAAIDSALAQTLPAREVVVVDDGSTDRTSEIVSRYDAPVRLVRIENDGTGQTRPLNIGIAQCDAEYIMLLDSDDRLEPHALARYAEAFQRCPRAGLVSSNWIDEFYESESRVSSRVNDALLVREHEKRVILDDLFLIESGVAYTMLCKGNFLRSCTGSSFSKMLWSSVGGFDESVRTSTDVNLFFRILRSHDMVYINQPLRVMTRHADNVSNAALVKRFKPDIYRDYLRIVERELAATSRTDHRKLLEASRREWLLGLAFAYRHMHRHWLAITTYLHGMRLGGRLDTGTKGIAMTILACLVYWVWPRPAPDAVEPERRITALRRDRDGARLQNH